MPFNIIRNDITRVEADALVNTANPEPAVGDGVDFAIYQAAGWDDLLAERRKIGKIEPGEARATKAYRLPARYVIHTVGPVWRGGGSGEQETLARCYRNSLMLAEKLGCESVAFPLISTGTFGFPKDLALSTAISEISDFLLEHDISVILVVYNKDAFVLSGRIFSDVRSYIEESDVLVRSGLDQNRPRRILAERSAASSLPPHQAGHPFYPGSALGSASGSSKETKPEDLKEQKLYEEDLCDKEALDLENPYDIDPEELEGFLHGRGETFQQKLFHMIDKKRLDDREVYKRANLDRKLFSKIKSNVNYNPTKKTVLALAIGMELNLDETVDLLKSAGYAFTPASVFDIIIEYCISHEFYNIIDIDCILFENGQPTLGG
ncbi:MAG: macro domain-containing protein [Eubacterium sp.]|nr:macro domain-containing protein [Eubacterium sp.]